MLSRVPFAFGAPAGSSARGGRWRLGLLLVPLAVAAGGLDAQAPPHAAGPAAEAQTGAPVELTLAEAWARAERVSPSLRVAQADVARGRATLARARGGFLPDLTASVGLQRLVRNQFDAAARAAGGPGTAAPDSGGAGATEALFAVFAARNTVTLGLQGSLTLFDGGRALAALRGARVARGLAADGVAAARAQLRLDVAGAYVDATLGDRLVAIAESALVQTARTYAATAVSARLGRTPAYDALRARVARDAQRPAVVQARGDRRLAYARLRRLVGVGAVELRLAPLGDADADDAPGSSSPVATFASDSEADIRSPAPFALLPSALPHAAVAAPSDASADRRVVDALVDDPAATRAAKEAAAAADTALERRGPVRRARGLVAVRRAELSAARAQRLPTLSVTSNYQRFAYPVRLRDTPALDRFFPNWTVGIGASLPLLAGGRIASDIRTAQANLAEAEAQLAQARDGAALDLEEAVASAEQAEAAWLAGSGATTQARRAFVIAEVRYRAGLATQVELGDARLALAQTAAGRARAARDRLLARVRLALLPDLPVGAGTAAGGAGPAVSGSGAPGAGAGANAADPGAASGGAW